VFYLYEIYADIDAFRTHLATRHVAQFFAEAAQHTTSDARALVQLVELPADDHSPEPTP
jgi:quinol monooxygenase YgiN